MRQGDINWYQKEFTNVDRFIFKLSIVMLLLIVIGCADDKTKVVSVPTVTRVPTEITSLNFSEGVTSGTVELTVTASTAIGADVDTKTTEGENDFSTTAQELESVIGISVYATEEVDPQDWYSISVVSDKQFDLILTLRPRKTISTYCCTKILEMAQNLLTDHLVLLIWRPSQ